MILECQAGEQFGLAAHFEAEIVRLAGIEDFFHYFAQLIDLNGENAAIFTLVIEFTDRASKRQVDGFDTVAKDVLKTDQDRKFQAASFSFFNDVSDID